MKRTPFHSVVDSDGFTLIEIIVTLTISAILAVILVQVVSNQTDRSYAPLAATDDHFAMHAAMENITAEYRLLTRSGTLDLNRFGADILAGNYWDTALTNGITITADYGCIPMGAPGDEATTDYCTQADAVLKVTLAVEENPGHRLIALFTQQ